VIATSKLWFNKNILTVTVGRKMFFYAVKLNSKNALTLLSIIVKYRYLSLVIDIYPYKIVEKDRIDNQR
jgi:hypothetical protein